MAITAIGVLAAFFAVVGGMGLWRAWAHLRHRRPLRAVTYGTLSGLSVVVGAGLGLGAVNLTAYQRLSYEQPVAGLAFQRIGAQRYRAFLSVPHGKTREFVLRGQDWMLEARVLKWRGWLELFGVKPQYQLRRLEGRYTDIAQARSAPRTVYQLVPRAGPDIWAQVSWFRRPLVDALYGSAVYLPMAGHAQYDVSLGQTGLIARPANAAARQALKQWQ